MANSYYNHSTYPTPNSPGSSAALRAELESITDGFDLLPTLAGNGYKVAMVNSTGTALIASAALQSLALTSSTIDSTAIGATTPAVGNFTNLSVSGTAGLGTAVTIGGGTINATPIGGTTPAAGAFTTLSASSGITGNLTGNVTGNVTGNAGTVTNGVYTTGSYSNPAWITALAGSKISGDISGNAANVTGVVALANGGTGASTAATARTALDVPSTAGSGATGTWGISISGNSATVTNGVVTTGSYSDPAWITSLAGTKISGNISGNSAGISGVLAVSQGGTGLSATPTNGQIDIGNGTGFTRAALTAGSGISITNGSGSITIAATGSGSGTVTSVDASGGTTGLTFSGGPVTASGTLTMAGTLAIANGGTGQTTANAALNALLPSQTSNNGKYLITDGTNVSWSTLTSLTGTTQSATPWLTSLGVSAATTATGIRNSAFGFEALKTVTTGANNTALGFRALELTTSSSNVAVGVQAGAGVTSGGNNIYIGVTAGTDNASGAANVGIGTSALLTTTGSSNNAAVGYYALAAVTSGANNTALGYQAGYSGSNNLTTGSNNIIIGYNAEASSGTVSNEATVGNGSITSFRVPGVSLTVGTSSFEIGGTSRRIVGDFSNATVPSRLMFQTSTVDTTTTVGFIPNGTGNTAQIALINSSSAANCSQLSLGATSTEARIVSTLIGSGTYLPLTFLTGGAERVRINTTGAIGLSGANYGTSGQVLTSAGSSAPPTWSTIVSTPDYVTQSYGIV